MKYILLLLLFCVSDLVVEKEERPNILFLIADDWSYPHASIYGDQVVRTPTFDFLAENGALFHHAYCASPSCSPSRASILTGRYPHQNESAGNLWSVFPDKFPNWVSLLKETGYLTGKERKGWAPGDYQAGGYEYNPAGKNYKSFDEFLEQKTDNQPFSYWFGSFDPHRIYETNTGVRSGMLRNLVEVPQFLPSIECVRNDMLDYYFEVERFDRECGNIIQQLEAAGELENTIIVMTSDNGMPFPRAKANLYDYGTRMPLAIYWKDKIKARTIVNDFVSFVDFAPSFLEAAGVKIPDDVEGNSFWQTVNGKESQVDRRRVFMERERHANVRKGDLSYPCRAIRTKDFLYIRNFEPKRYPAGDPNTHVSVGQYGDVDNSISKFLIMNRIGESESLDYFELTFGKRPAEELYEVQQDPFQLNNLANNEEYAATLEILRKELKDWMIETNDLRATEPQTIYWDTVRYTPKYQFYDFDLEEGIKNYNMLEKVGNGFDSLKCVVD
ncbi:MAG: sulfatase [Bacteroidota bacterium]